MTARKGVFSGDWRRSVAALAVGVLTAVASGRVAAGSLAAGGSAELDRMALAVAGIESSWGNDPAMWRADPQGPQGPMQISAAAALDAGGGDRFDAVENRALGRGYLAELHRRYRDWPDAVAAYNWGPGNLDAWIARGRPPDAMPVTVALYRALVMRLAVWGPTALGVRPGLGHRQPRRPLADLHHPTRATLAVERLYRPILGLAEPELR